MKKYLLFTILVFIAVAVKAQDMQPSKYSFGVRIIGKGRPMILIPGLKGAPDTYNDVVAHYKEHYKCYVITLAGFAGQPANADTLHPLQTQRDQIIQYIIDKHLKKPILVGFSFGGTLALWITITRPDLIGPLVELDGVPFDDGIESDHVNMDSLRRDAKLQRYRTLNATSAVWKHLDSVRHTNAFRKSGFVYLQNLLTDTNRIKQVLNWDDASDYKATWLMLDETETLDLRDSVAKISSPILVLGSWKGWDNLKTKDAVEKRYQMEYAPAKNVTIVFSENGKHFLMYEDFDWMITEMDKFLAKH